MVNEQLAEKAQVLAVQLASEGHLQPTEAFAPSTSQIV